MTAPASTLSLAKALAGMRTGSLRPTELLSRCLQATEQWNTRCNAIVDRSSTDYDDIRAQAERADRKYAENASGRSPSTTALGALEGVPVVVKANIATTEMTTSCASKMLAGYRSPFDATVVAQLKRAGAIVIGKSNMDEFGMGSFNNNSAHGASVQVDGERVAGGSSGGSAVAVQAGMCLAALGSDTGGSVRMPAAYCGVVGFKPSYGRYSRWGLVPYANSLDTVGTLTSTVQDVRLLHEVLDTQDSQDHTTMVCHQTPAPSTKRYPTLRVGVPIEYNLLELTPEVRELWSQAIESLEDQGAEVCSISLPNTMAALVAYYIIAPAEASSNLAKFDGIRYGHLNPASLSKSRSESFGSEVRRRILMGTFAMSSSAVDAYFVQAQRVRRQVTDDFNAAFRSKHPVLKSPAPASDTGVDVILTPAAISCAPKLSELTNLRGIDMYVNDVMTIPASLAGLPAITVPSQKANKGLGLQLIAQYGDDELVLDTAQLLEGRI
ncbi:Trimeric GatFAB AmidoTransferase(AdT) complex subunit [Sorochytrium milnesiophthora]